MKKIVLILLFNFICFRGEAQKEIKILILGDSLTEGYGVAKDKAFPSLIERELKKTTPKVQVINAGISGSTTASGVSRLKWLLKGNPNYLILALGSNDGLRGIRVAVSRKHLSQTIELAQKHGVKVILAGLQMPPNYGAKYTREFASMFVSLAKKYQLPLIPFLLDGVAGEAHLNQADGIHPNEKGHEKLAQNVLKTLRPLL